MRTGRCGDGMGKGGNLNPLDGQQKPPRKVVALARAKKEAKLILTDEQYWDLVGLIERLYDYGDASATQDLDIKPFRKFHEFRVKGGFIRNINLRIYFAYVASRNEIVILMAYKKEEDRRVSPHIHILLDDRLEDYLLGSRRGMSVYPRGSGRRADP